VQLVDRSRGPLEVRRVLAGERDGPDRLLGPGLARRRRRPARTGTELPQCPEHRGPAAPAQLEEEERVLVEGLAEHIVRGRDMLAGVGPVRARARGLEVLHLGRKEAPAGGAERLVDLLRHLAREQLGGEDRLVGHLHDGLVPRAAV